MPPKKQIQANRRRNQPAARPKPTGRTKQSNANTFRNTRVVNANMPGSSRRVKSTHHIMDVTTTMEPIVVSAIGIRRWMITESVLSQLFSVFEQYFVHDLKFEFVPELPVTEPGSIHMSPDYDPSDTTPQTTAAMSNNIGYRSGPISQKLVVNMPNLRTPDNSFVRPMLYTAPNHPERFTDFGKLWVGTSGSTAGATDIIGRIIMHYDITFFLPQVPAILDITEVDATQFDVTHTLTSSDAYATSDLSFDTDELNITFSNGGTPKNMVQDAVYSANIYNPGGVNIGLYDTGGRLVREGTRIYFRPVRGTVTTSGASGGLTYTPERLTPAVGAISTSRTFAEGCELLFQGVTLAAIMLRNIRMMTKGV